MIQVYKHVSNAAIKLNILFNSQNLYQYHLIGKGYYTVLPNGHILIPDFDEDTLTLKVPRFTIMSTLLELFAYYPVPLRWGGVILGVFFRRNLNWNGNKGEGGFG